MGVSAGENIKDRETDEANVIDVDVVDQYLFMSLCCYVEQVQHQRQQYVGSAIAWGVIGCKFKLNVNVQIKLLWHTCTHMFTQMQHTQMHSSTLFVEVDNNWMGKGCSLNSNTETCLAGVLGRERLILSRRQWQWSPDRGSPQGGAFCMVFTYL